MSDRARGGGHAGALYAETLMAAWTAYSYNIPQRATTERVSFQRAESQDEKKRRRRTHLVNQMARRLNQPQQLGHIPAPPVQNLVARLLLGKIYHSGRPVDSRVDRLVHYERGEGRLRLSQRQVEQGRKSVERDARVVARDSPDVLRDQ